MDQRNPEVELHFSQPVRQVTLMLIVLGLTAFGVYVAAPRVAGVFLSSPYLNGFIAFVFVMGVLSCFWQVLQLIQSVNWIERFTGFRPSGETPVAPRLLAPLAALMRSRGKRTQISTTAATSILDSVATRIDEAREITRYISNLLIFLGLLGTFYGLATTVPAVVDTIRSLAPADGETAADVFPRLMSGLEEQLGGMGTAFASSLLGLAGSLVVGLLELFASHGQNRFFRELEEWISTFTRIGFASEGDTGDAQAGGMMDYVSAQMDALQSLFVQSDVSRALVDERLGTLATSIERMTGVMEARATAATPGQEAATAQALTRLAEGQERLIALLERRDTAQGAQPHQDAESRMRLRSMDVQLLRILEEISAGRQESLAEVRADIAALTRAVRQSAGPASGR
ncbi:hypothetical protein AQS8620_00511 [Aquimixticola soesokkakensis]|uniref:Biopolymer transporter ExbB n=1 Tax=Aquimixticola soesokkakensis TaxID=1519096 RepID=A0A1Y5RLJ1_9RHOB|nr:biopolymer transporter ExbB [Aquimixticola soesokkakensis]SLN20314.1 hypothetical protein AQS8620_00511 [Aquimixticola soesokkakensis]